MTDNAARVADGESGEVRATVSADGQPWLVREVELATNDRRSRSLAFTAEEEMRPYERL